MHESKCLKERECKRQPDFSRGVDVLAHTPNPRCDTH